MNDNDDRPTVIGAHREGVLLFMMWDNGQVDVINIVSEDEGRIIVCDGDPDGFVWRALTGKETPFKKDPTP